MANAETIKKNYDLFVTRLKTSPPLDQIPLEVQLPQEGARQEIVVQPPAAQQPVVEPTPPPAPQRQDPPAQPPRQETNQQTPQPRPQPDPQPPPAQTRERTVYFTQIDRDGQILHSRVVRRLPVSESPMTDALNAVLMGPTADELNRGLINLIPQNTRILSAAVRGSTAYISFSEDFLFNTFGIEGYVAQLRQVVWTATEFSNVRDVQILIEGRRLDYLGEGIWIGSPISRQSF